MTGYRLGAASGSASFIQAMSSLASSSHTHPCMLSQYAGIAALSLSSTWEKDRLQELRFKRDLLFNGLQKIQGLSVKQVAGGLYLFPDYF